MNAIERVFAKIKTLMRKADACNKQEINDEIAKFSNKILPSECVGYCRDAGYILS